MTKRESHDTARHVFIVVLTIFVILVFIIFFAVVHREKNPDDSFPIEGPFSVTINDKDYGQVDFDDFSFPAVVKGDRLKISFDMPDTKVPNAILTLYQDNSALRVYFDEKLVLEKGTAASRLVGYGYYSIQLLEEYAGMHVRYELDIVEDENVTTLPKPVINNAAIYLRNFIGDNGFYFIIDIAIVILCLAIMLIACIFSGIQKDFGRLAFLGMSFFMMAVWELCSYDLIRIFTDDLVLKAYLEYLSLYLGPFFLSLYFYLEFFTNAPAKIRKTYNFITGMQGLFPVLALILHFTDIIHLPAILPLFHIILLINVAFMFFVLIRRFIIKDYTHKPMVTGLIIMVVLAALDMGRFIIYKMFFTYKTENFISFLLIGFFIFLVAMLVDFFLEQKNTMYVVARAEAMDRLAHEDFMTGLANRTRCEEMFFDLGHSKGVFALISIDINYLKLTNDRYGHQEGDRLLIDFSKVMKGACENEPVTAGRMGGDEFVVIIPGLENDVDQRIVEKMDKLGEELNADRKPLPLSFSYGICRSNDAAVSGSSDIVEAVYRVADERMYEMKKNMKARREDVG